MPPAPTCRLPVSKELGQQMLKIITARSGRTPDVIVDFAKSLADGQSVTKACAEELKVALKKVRFDEYTEQMITQVIESAIVGRHPGFVGCTKCRNLLTSLTDLV